MRKMCLKMVHELAAADERIVFIGSDLGLGTMDEFKRDFPSRFFMEGIAEQAVVGMAAGMAMDGKIPYVNTIATFLSRRAYEQIILDLCLHNLPVRLIGNGGGVVYAPLGPTHQAIEDIAALRAVPNITILCPADADEMQRLMPKTVEIPGPVYIRLAKGWDPVVTEGNGEFEIGKVVSMAEGKDALLLTTGIGLQNCLAARDLLAEKGLDAGVLHLPTIKPLDTEAILDGLAKVPVAVSVEEHVLTGGLGSAIAEVLAESDMLEKPRFKRLGLPDKFMTNYGSQALLLEQAGLHPAGISQTVMELS